MPETTSWTQWDGTSGVVYYNSQWTVDGDELTSVPLVDISTLSPAPASVRVRRFVSIIIGDISSTVEFSGGELVYRTKNHSNASMADATDFSLGPNGGRGGTGDVHISTTNAEISDELTVILYFEKG